MRYSIASLFLLCIVATAFARPLNDFKKPGQHINDETDGGKAPTKREATEDVTEAPKPKREATEDVTEAPKPKREATEDVTEAPKPKREAVKAKKPAH
uniref:Uncharacterized protein n=1 Tax=Panagrolaimus davidi TaxID=227884 RepID=A0A914PFJ6_9BILA